MRFIGKYMDCPSAKRDGRLCYIDIAKGFAIIAVVLWHINISFGECKLLPIKTIFAGGMWHVPVFFMLSGFFLNDEKIINTFSFIVGKLKSIHLFTLFFYIPAVLLHNTFFAIGFYSLNANYAGKAMSLYSYSDYLKNLAAAICFAGREPIVGPLWFAYVLSLAFIGFAIITRLCFSFKKNVDYKKIRLIICLVLACFSAVISNKLGFTLNRFSNTLVVMLLLAIGQFVFQERKVTFDSKFIFTITLFLAWQNSVLNGDVNLNNNSYNDIFHLICGSFCSLYVICFISKKISETWLGIFLVFVGKKSFYIMALHFLGFKIFAAIIKIFNTEYRLDFLTPNVNSNLYLWLGYFLFGLFFPLFVSYIVTKFKCAPPKKKNVA